MKQKYFIIGVLIAMGGIAITLYLNDFSYAYLPQKNKVLSYKVNDQKGFDLWGKRIKSTPEEIQKLSVGTKPESLSSEVGAVEVDDQMLEMGRDVFYKETFGNEVFFTDIMGVINGPFTIGKITKALLALKGEGTTNLRVELANDVTIGGRRYKAGEKIDTGIDVPKGSLVPLGMPVSWENRKVRVGVSCAACHATVDPHTKEVIEGAPNNDFNVGLIMALATNSTAYFTHADVKNLQKYMMELDPSITDSTGKETTVPEPVALESEVDRIFASWPRGNFDSTIDMIGNPAQIPDSFTFGDHPYGWSGFAAAGPFNGLAAFSNNVHAQNADSLSQADISKPLFDIDKEVYLATILRNAANPTFRYKPNLQIKASEHFARVDPTPGAPGVNQIVVPPQFPKVSLVAPDGLIVSENGFKFNEQNNAVASWQNTINPPKPTKQINADKIERGREVFVRAGCISCHAGSNLTNNKVISAKVIGTEPSRAKALKKTEKVFGESVLYSPDTPVPIPSNPKVLKVPTDHLDPEQIKLAFAHGDSPGGYKVPSLIGLYWTAPYLHDGGVAVGPNGELGMSGTLLKGVLPDPRKSLKAMIDRGLRTKVVQTNTSSEQLKNVHVSGMGHNYWIDQVNGFTKEEQDAVLDYLLSLNAPLDK
ncbi:electron transport protein [Mesobacillus foraminis]|uniref:electron transport protein n=1 Tax=Mesobacillus foraminis TaxID=279826 RepID=UPI001BE8282C|nr:electron transport protein [Mesobacillus foraminis]MBT2756786.1 electron transport protein [Mesobacillus foraminis]